MARYMLNTCSSIIKLSDGVNFHMRKQHNHHIREQYND